MKEETSLLQKVGISWKQIGYLLVAKFKSISVGQMLMMIDGSIVVMAMIVYQNVESGIYAILAIAVASIVTDKMSSGFNKANMFYIFANKNPARAVMSRNNPPTAPRSRMRVTR